MKAYRASADGGYGATAETPRKAAEKFFSDFPNKRKCSVHEGETDGHFFTVALGRGSPKSWKDVTKKQVCSLPDTEELK